MVEWMSSSASSNGSDIQKEPARRSRGPWLKAVLIPFWALQLPLQLFLLIITIINAVYSVGLETIASVFLVLVWFSNTFLIATEITLFVTRRLRPLAYLVLQIVKTTLSLGLLIFASVLTGRIYHLNPKDQSAGTAKLIWSLVLIVLVEALYIGSLVYASVIFRRHRHAAPTTQNEFSTRQYDPRVAPFANVNGLHEAPAAPAVFEKDNLVRRGTFHESDSTAVATPCTARSEVGGSRKSEVQETDSSPLSELQCQSTLKGPGPHVVAELGNGAEVRGNVSELGVRSSAGVPETVYEGKFF